jgi:hypothetical protein
MRDLHAATAAATAGLFDELPAVPPLVPKVDPVELGPELPQPTMNPQPEAATNNRINRRLIMDGSLFGR